ncbi:hypothetical protein AB0I81_38890 [Nonomuraea sp. NPDC050404]|uniref:hypothetical protein n=1 Tax=Nonomuraea sp. NPDC050404 TaxID=3155783 RepID=UPI0033DA77FB
MSKVDWLCARLGFSKEEQVLEWADAAESVSKAAEQVGWSATELGNVLVVMEIAKRKRENREGRQAKLERAARREELEERHAQEARKTMREQLERGDREEQTRERARVERRVREAEKDGIGRKRSFFLLAMGGLKYDCLVLNEEETTAETMETLCGQKGATLRRRGVVPFAWSPGEDYVHGECKEAAGRLAEKWASGR